jgi:hypothetical protein
LGNAGGPGNRWSRGSGWGLGFIAFFCIAWEQRCLSGADRGFLGRRGVSLITYHLLGSPAAHHLVLQLWGEGTAGSSIHWAVCRVLCCQKMRSKRRNHYCQQNLGMVQKLALRLGVQTPVLHRVSSEIRHECLPSSFRLDIWMQNDLSIHQRVQIAKGVEHIFSG